jgi:DNA-binding response OmpR family regulator
MLDELLHPVVIVSDDDSQIVRAIERQARTAGLWVVPDLRSEAPKIARLVRPAVIVLDLNQDRYGLDLLVQIKSDEATASTTVIMLTSVSSPEVREACLAAGASAYLEKPLDIAKLVYLAQQAALGARQRHTLESKRKRSAAGHMQH